MTEHTIGFYKIESARLRKETQTLRTELTFIGTDKKWKQVYKEIVATESDYETAQIKIKLSCTAKRLNSAESEAYKTYHTRQKMLSFIRKFLKQK